MPFTPRHGKNTTVFFDTFDLQTYFNEASVAAEVDTAETTTFGPVGNAKTYVVGLEDGTISVSGLFDGTTQAVDEVLSGTLGQPNGDSIVTVGWEGTTIGMRCSMAAVIETSYEVTSPVADVVSTKAEFQGDGSIDSGVYLAARVAVGGTGAAVNQASVDAGAGTTNGGVAHLHVTNNGRTAGSVIKVQHSTDNSTFTDLVTFTTTGAGPALLTQRVLVAAGTTVNRYLRAQVTPGGTTNTITVTVSFARR